MNEQNTEKPPESSGEIEPERKEDTVEIPLIGVVLPRRIVPWLVVGLVAVMALGWPFLRHLPTVWFDEEGYYSHGILIPFMALAVIYMRRTRIRSEPVGSSTIGLIIMALGLLLLLAGRRIDNNLSISAAGFIMAIIGGVYYVFGRRIARHTLGPLLFLGFMMPVLGWFIDNFTNPLQIMSTRIAEKMLNIAGFDTIIPPAYPTLIFMDHYELLVGGPCSGFKLILSLAAFTTFFVMISNLGWTRNIVLFAIMFPLALVINGLRIMLIGVVGENAYSPMVNWMHRYGPDPGIVFHNYSGYVTLVVCFVVLHFIVRALEKGRGNAEAS
ncbi:MAG: exosortase/archaeosortase family protein [Armatimonadetes bacterium]|nr:exosortase/archaeosortase family protein [Armatimonadota bacterium]